MLQKADIELQTLLTNCKTLQACCTPALFQSQSTCNDKFCNSTFYNALKCNGTSNIMEQLSFKYYTDDEFNAVFSNTCTYCLGHKGSWKMFLVLLLIGFKFSEAPYLCHLKKLSE